MKEHNTTCRFRRSGVQNS